VDNFVGAWHLSRLDGFGEGGSSYKFDASFFGGLDDLVDACVDGEAVVV
jgi:hypothetical protein